MASKRQNKKVSAARQNEEISAAQAQPAAEDLTVQEPQPGVPQEQAPAVPEAETAPESVASEPGAPENAAPEGKAAAGADVPEAPEQTQQAPKKPRRRRTRKKPVQQETPPAEGPEEPQPEQQSKAEKPETEPQPEAEKPETGEPGRENPETEEPKAEEPGPENPETEEPEETKPGTEEPGTDGSGEQTPEPAEAAEESVRPGETPGSPAPCASDDLMLPEMPAALLELEAAGELTLPEAPEALQKYLTPFELPGLPDGLAKPSDPPKKRKKKKKKKRKKRHHWLFWTFVLLTMMIAGGSGWYSYWLFTESESTLFRVRDDVELPNLLGLRWNDVQTNEAFSSFTFEMVEVYHDEAPAGEIVDQNPRAPRQVKDNSRIIVKVSKGVETVTVPDIVGWNKDTAREKLSEMNLTMMFRTENIPDVPSESVIRTEPEAGALVKAGTTITVYIRRESQALTYVTVPTCIGAESESQAGVRLTQRGLLMRTITVEDEAPEGTVIDQSPSPGTMVTRGTYVTLTISQGPPPPPPPPPPAPEEKDPEEEENPDPGPDDPDPPGPDDPDPPGPDDPDPPGPDDLTPGGDEDHSDLNTDQNPASASSPAPAVLDPFAGGTPGISPGLP